jgi:hypothetical protein
MAKLSIYLGAALCVIGVLGYVITGMEHWTSLIPTLLAVPIIVCGVLTQKTPEKAKLYMHIAVVCAFLIFAGSVSRIPKLDDSSVIKAATIWSATLISFMLLGFYIQSFLKARMAKQD